MSQYMISPGIASNVVGEGVQLNFTITGNGSDGTQLYWSNVGTTNASDFVEGLNSGFLTLSNGEASLRLTLKADALTEGTETVNLQIYKNALVATTSAITVPDTSTIPLYTISPANAVTVAGEGITLTFTISTNAPHGRRFYWANLGTTSAGDFVENVKNGFLEVSNGTATLTLNVKNDAFTEGDETVRIALYHDIGRTQLATLSGVVTVPDTSMTPLAPTALPNLYMWLDGSDPDNTGIPPANNTVISSWVDKSGASNNLVQSNVANNPTYSNSAIVFSSTTAQYLSYPSNNLITGYDYYAVTTPRLNSAQNSTMGVGPNGNTHVVLTNGSNLGQYGATNASTFSQYGTTTINFGTRILLNVRVASNGYPSIGINAPETLIPNNVSNATVTVRPIAFGANPWHSTGWGDINEFVQYNSNLSLSDRQKIEGYLAWKWNLVNSLQVSHPYKYIRPTQGPPTYTITPSSNVNIAGEGAFFTFVIGTDAPLGTRIYWSNLGTTSAADFVENTNSGFIDFLSRPLQLKLRMKVDGLVESSETIQIAIYTDEERTSQVALSGIVTLPDVTAPFVPTLFPNLSIWLDATDPENDGSAPANGTTITGWADKSGGGRNMVQNATNRNPTYSNNGVTFTGNLGFNYPPDISPVNSDIFVVSTPRTGAYSSLAGYTTTSIHIMGVYGTALVSYNGGFVPFGSLTVASNTVQLITLRSSSTGLLSAAINGTETLTTNNVTASGTMLFLANSIGYNQPWGTINEFVQYSSNLSLADRQKIEGYLAWKWDIVGSLPSNHPYKTTQPTA